MGRKISSSSWVARYDSDDEIINGNEIYEARSKALNEGCAYLLKIIFVDEPDFIIEEAFRYKEDALAVAKRLIKYHSGVRFVVVFQMHGENCFGDGYKHYSYLTGICTEVNEKFA